MDSNRRPAAPRRTLGAQDSVLLAPAAWLQHGAVRWPSMPPRWLCSSPRKNSRCCSGGRPSVGLLLEGAHGPACSSRLTPSAPAAGRLPKMMMLPRSNCHEYLKKTYFIPRGGRAARAAAADTASLDSDAPLEPSTGRRGRIPAVVSFASPPAH